MYHPVLIQQPRGSVDVLDVLACSHAVFSSLCFEFPMSVLLSPDCVLEFPRKL